MIENTCLSVVPTAGGASTCFDLKKGMGPVFETFIWVGGGGVRRCTESKNLGNLRFSAFTVGDKSVVLYSDAINTTINTIL